MACLDILGVIFVMQVARGYYLICGHIFSFRANKQAWYNNVTGIEYTSVLTHCGTVKPYGDIDLGYVWRTLWFGAWRHQAIAWKDID